MSLEDHITQSSEKEAQGLHRPWTKDTHKHPQTVLTDKFAVVEDGAEEVPEVRKEEKDESTSEMDDDEDLFEKVFDEDSIGQTTEKNWLRPQKKDNVGLQLHPLLLGDANTFLVATDSKAMTRRAADAALEDNSGLQLHPLLLGDTKTVMVAAVDVEVDAEEMPDENHKKDMNVTFEMDEEKPTFETSSAEVTQTQKPRAHKEALWKKALRCATEVFKDVVRDAAIAAFVLQDLLGEAVEPREKPVQSVALASRDLVEEIEQIDGEMYADRLPCHGAQAVKPRQDLWSDRERIWRLSRALDVKDEASRDKAWRVDVEESPDRDAIQRASTALRARKVAASEEERTARQESRDRVAMKMASVALRAIKVAAAEEERATKRDRIRSKRGLLGAEKVLRAEVEAKLSQPTWITRQGDSHMSPEEAPYEEKAKLPERTTREGVSHLTPEANHPHRSSRSRPPQNLRLADEAWRKKASKRAEEANNARGRVGLGREREMRMGLRSHRAQAAGKQRKWLDNFRRQEEIRLAEELAEKDSRDEALKLGLEAFKRTFEASKGLQYPDRIRLKHALNVATEVSRKEVVRAQSKRAKTAALDAPYWSDRERLTQALDDLHTALVASPKEVRAKMVADPRKKEDNKTLKVDYSVNKDVSRKEMKEALNRAVKAAKLRHYSDHIRPHIRRKNDPIIANETSRKAAN